MTIAEALAAYQWANEESPNSEIPKAEAQDPVYAHEHWEAQDVERRGSYGHLGAPERRDDTSYSRKHWDVERRAPKPSIQESRPAEALRLVASNGATREVEEFEDWREEAICRQVDPALWFGNPRNAQVRAICEGCPVREPCLQAAIKADERHGIWGGLSAAERDAEGLRRYGPRVMARWREQANRRKDAMDVALLVWRLALGMREQGEQGATQGNTALAPAADGLAVLDHPWDRGARLEIRRPDSEIAAR